jgi:branched-chain amino acid transport system permease protein
LLVQQLINGITLGSIYALIAVGYAMVFSLLELINFAHGSIFMVGAFAGLLLITGSHLPFPLAFVLAMVVTGAVGIMVERTAVSPLRRRSAPRVASLISTIGMGILIENLALLTMGTEIRPFPKPFATRSFDVLGARVSSLELVILALSIGLMVLLQLFVRGTRIGTALRACAQDLETTELMGVNTNVVIAVTFGVGSALAASAGILVGMYYNFVEPTMGTMAGIKGFVASVLGGRGLIAGGVLGGLVLGVVESLGVAIISAGYRDVIAFAILILILLFKPAGLLGSAQR